MNHGVKKYWNRRASWDKGPANKILIFFKIIWTRLFAGSSVKFIHKIYFTDFLINSWQNIIKNSRTIFQDIGMVQYVADFDQSSDEDSDDIEDCNGHRDDIDDEESIDDDENEHMKGNMEPFKKNVFDFLLIMQIYFSFPLLKFLFFIYIRPA